MPELVEQKHVNRLFVIETDAPCKRCGRVHKFVTTMCALAVFVDIGTAYWVAKDVEGSRVREIDSVPVGTAYTLYLQKGGRRDGSLPLGVSRLNGGARHLQSQRV